LVSFLSSGWSGWFAVAQDQLGRRLAAPTGLEGSALLGASINEKILKQKSTFTAIQWAATGDTSKLAIYRFRTRFEPNETIFGTTIRAFERSWERLCHRRNVRCTTIKRKGRRQSQSIVSD